MKVFFAVTLLACNAFARPDVSSLGNQGYNYGRGSDLGTGGSGHGFTDFDSLGSGLGSSASDFGGHFQAPLINKQFYLHSAPEDRDEAYHKHIRLGRPSKNYRVVFVKAPSSGATRYSVEYAPQEEKTAIYVLAQKEHEIDIGDIATPAPTQPSKPEVFFIKYKTPQEVESAQRQIQAQYDHLGGSSQFTDEGIAPVRNVIGSLGSEGGSFPSASTSGLGNAYLPPRASGLSNKYIPPSLCY